MKDKRRRESPREKYTHARSLETSTALSAYYIPNYITPLDLMAVLDAAGVRSVLGGTHGLGGWRQKPRTDQDVVIHVAASNHKKAVRKLLASFPRLRARDNETETTLHDLDPQGVVIEVVKPVGSLQRRVLFKTLAVLADGQTYRIPSLEMSLALVFAPMTRLPWSEADKYQHIHDFMCMSDSNSNIDEKELAAFGELVYGGGGADIVEMVKRVRAGEKLNL